MASLPKRQVQLLSLILVILGSAIRLGAQSPAKPNILVIMGHDIGWYNTSIYNTNLVAQCAGTCKLGDLSFHNHLDGYNLIPFFNGEAKEPPRKEFLYSSDDGDLFALRYGDWKIVFIEQNHKGLDIWMQGFNKLRVPKIFNLPADPFERGDGSFLYDNWMVHRVFLAYGAQSVVAGWLKSFKEFPIRQRPASFNLDEVMTKLTPIPE